MKTLFPFLLCIALLSGCVSGPAHDYYNPILVGGPRYTGPITLALVEDLAAEQAKCTREGYAVIGSTKYTGKPPKSNELSAQARRVHANHVIYSVKEAPLPPVTWHFTMGGWSVGGGSEADQCRVQIVFLGK
jgi:hypothetical protein